MVAFETVFTVSSSGLRLAVASEVISNLGVQAILVIQVLLLFKFKLNHDDSKLERKYMIFLLPVYYESFETGDLNYYLLLFKKKLFYDKQSESLSSDLNSPRNTPNGLKLSSAVAEDSS